MAMVLKIIAEREYWGFFIILLNSNSALGHVTYVLSCFSHVRFLVTIWAVAPRLLSPQGFSRQEYWNGLPCPPPGGLPHPGIEPMSLMHPTRAGEFYTTAPPGKPLVVLVTLDTCCSTVCWWTENLDETQRKINFLIGTQISEIFYSTVGSTMYLHVNYGTWS